MLGCWVPWLKLDSLALVPTSNSRRFCERERKDKKRKRKRTKDSCPDRRKVFLGHMSQVQSWDDCTSAREKIVLLEEVAFLDVGVNAIAYVYFSSIYVSRWLTYLAAAFHCQPCKCCGERPTWESFCLFAWGNHPQPRRLKLKNHFSIGDCFICFYCPHLKLTTSHIETPTLQHVQHSSWYIALRSIARLQFWEDWWVILKKL